jgi:hypothetical protein
LDQHGVVSQPSGESNTHILTHFHFDEILIGMEIQKHVDAGDINKQVSNGQIEKTQRVWEIPT